MHGTTNIKKTDRVVDLYILDPSQIVTIESSGGVILTVHNYRYVIKCYYYYYGLLLFINLLLYFFQEIIIHTPTLILLVLNLSVKTSKFYPVEILCDC